MCLLFTLGLLDVKLKKSHCCSRDANFSNRVVNIWNALPSYIVQSPCVATFKTVRNVRFCKSSLGFKLMPYFSVVLIFLLGHL